MDKTPSRIVSLAPSNTEILWALGLGDRLVGVDSRSNYPPEVRRLPRVGKGLDIDVGTVAELKPELVVASLSVPGMERNLPKLETQRLRYVVIDPKSLGDVLQSILDLGEVTGRVVEAQRLVQQLGDRMDVVASRVSEASARPGVYWEWWPRPLITPGRKSWITDMIEMAGGVNVFGDQDRESVNIDEDMVFTRSPEVIVASWCGAEKMADRERIKGRRGWQILPAVQNDRVYAVEEESFGRPGPRLVEGLEAVARMLHPEMFEE